MIRFLAFSLTRGGGGFMGTLGTPPRYVRVQKGVHNL